MDSRGDPLEDNDDKCISAAGILEVGVLEYCEEEGAGVPEREVAIFREEYGVFGRRIEVIQVLSTVEILIRIKATGQFIQATLSPGGNVFGGLLGSIRQGSLVMEPFLARSSENVLFCCRLYMEESNEKHYLFHDPSDGNGSKVQSLALSSNTISSSTLDGRCFIRRDLGNDTIFQSLLQEDLFLFYDKRRRTLTMRIFPASRILNLTTARVQRVPKELLFSIETIRERDRRETNHSASIRRKFLNRLTHCFKRSSSTYAVSNRG